MWSVPQTQMKTQAKKKKISFRELFMTKSAPRSYAPKMNPVMAGIPESYFMPQQQIPAYAPQSQFSAPSMNMVKKGGQLLSLIVPLVLAFLGIPFYVMLILKFFNLFQ